MPGPNDFHGVMIDGVWTQKPGLNEYEPSSVATLPEPPKTQELRKKAAELDAIEESLRVRADKLAAREAELDRLTAPR